ncbi:hypothetical protein GCM10029964_054650 [Kibdelosporangium lantanae]
MTTTVREIVPVLWPGGRGACAVLVAVRANIAHGLPLSRRGREAVAGRIAGVQLEKIES